MTGIPFLKSSSMRTWQAEKSRLFSLSLYWGEGNRIFRKVSLAKMKKDGVNLFRGSLEEFMSIVEEALRSLSYIGVK